MEIKVQHLMNVVEIVRHMGTPTRAEIKPERLQIRLNTGTRLHFDTSELPQKQLEMLTPVLKQAFRGIRVRSEAA